MRWLSLYELNTGFVDIHFRVIRTHLTFDEGGYGTRRTCPGHSRAGRSPRKDGKQRAKVLEGPLPRQLLDKEQSKAGEV